MTLLSWECATSWWRFSDYRFADGHLSAAPGARLECYEPWASFKPAGTRFEEGAPQRRAPYQDLQAIATARDGERVAKIVAFTNEWGLLGLLPNSLLEVIFPLVWDTKLDEAPLAVANQRDWLHVRASRLHRTNEGWVQPRIWRDALGTRSAGEVQQNRLLYEPDSPDWNTSTSIVMRKMDDVALDILPFGYAWTRYFNLPPGSPSPLEYDYPTPTTDEFWPI